MSKLFVYYSLSGNGDYIAQLMKAQGYDVLKVETKKRMPKSFIGQILAGGFAAGIEKCEALSTDISAVESCDELVVGTPIWNSRITPAINTVLKKIDGTTKLFDVICWSGSGNPGKLKTQLQAVKVRRITALKQPLDNKEDCEKIIKDTYAGR